MPTRGQARDRGEQVVREVADGARDLVRERVRRAIGVRGRPPASCEDPAAAYQPVDGAARQIHGDLPSMLVGGVASLLLQLLHPAVMQGVADHSRYRDDALGRLARTASFVAVTTYGTRDDARAAIARVRRIHETVTGIDPAGHPYDAADPHLLGWVHLTEVAMFLRGAELYGPRTVTPTLADRYVAEMASIARDLGVPDPPRDVAALQDQMASYVDELALSDPGRAARDFLLAGVATRPVRRLTYATIAVAAVGALPGWARTKLGVVPVPLVHELLVRPSALALASLMRVAVPPRPLPTSRS